jgi:hypothetical protein
MRLGGPDFEELEKMVNAAAQPGLARPQAPAVPHDEPDSGEFGEEAPTEIFGELDNQPQMPAAAAPAPRGPNPSQPPMRPSPVSQPPPMGRPPQPPPRPPTASNPAFAASPRSPSMGMESQGQYPQPHQGYPQGYPQQGYPQRRPRRSSQNMAHGTLRSCPSGSR